MAWILSVDAGTTGVRTLALSDSGEVGPVAYRPLTQHYPRPGWVEHDGAEIWSLVQSTLTEVAGRLAETGDAVAGVGIANQRETALAWDRRSGRPVAPAIVWQDRRTAARCEALADQGVTPLVRRATGLVLDPYASATKWEWLFAHGLEPSADLCLGTVDSWVLWHLTGGPVTGTFATDPTNASRTMLYDLPARRWSEELCGLFGIPPRSLPDVRPSCGRLGTVAPEALPGAPALAGVPVSAVAGDQQAALFGQACVGPGLAKVTYGTGSFVLTYAGSAPPDPAEGIIATVAWDLGALGSGPEYALEGSAFVSGAAIQWLRDELGIVSGAGEMGPLAASVGDAGGVVVVPAFTGLGSPWWDPRARGAVIGISATTGRAHLARAVVEAMAFEVRDIVAAMDRSIPGPCSELRADGGASAMGLLLQVQANQLGIPVVRPRCTESTALGAALLAGLAEGVWGSVAEATAMWQPEEAHHRAEAPEAADAAYGRWLAALDRARRWARDEPSAPG